MDWRRYKLYFAILVLPIAGCAEPSLSYDKTFSIFERELRHCMGIGKSELAAECAEERTLKALHALGIRGAKPCISDIAGTWQRLSNDVAEGQISAAQAAVSFEAFKSLRNNRCAVDAE